MAGGKETPRQKLIGMMYLVLTALLALNVSVTVLDKFVDINRALEVSVDAAQEQNSNTLKRIENTVEESGSRPDDVKILETGREIRTKTAEILAELNEYKKQFISITGGTDDKGDFVGKTDYDAVGNYMMAENEGHGPPLQAKLNEFSSYLNKLFEEDGTVSFDPIAPDAKDDPAYKDSPNHKMMDWSTLQFMGAPMPAGLATISQIQNKVMSYEGRALDALARSVGAADLKFDLISLVALPESKIVAAGAKYKADLFVSAASSAAENPEMTLNGNPIPVENGKGKIEFTASGGNYDKDGLIRKTFEATITLKDSTYRSEIEYFVIKPVISVRSAAISALYLGAGNKLNVDVPQLGAAYNPSFSATGADVIPGGGSLVTIVPNAPEVKLTVRQDGNVLGVETFKVQRIPKPSIQIIAGNRPVNLKNGESVSAVRQLRAVAVPEENFKAQLPDDAQYLVNDWSVTLVRGVRAVGPPVKSSNPTVNLTAMLGQARPGDVLLVQIDRVVRRNFRGQVNAEQISNEQSIVRIPLN